MNTVTIDFSKLGGPTYIGRSNGVAARRKLELDKLETDAGNTFVVDIPESTYNINSSFFLGLFGASIKRSGTISNFYKNFKFETHGKQYKAIERGIERALVQEKGLGIN